MEYCSILINILILFNCFFGISMCILFCLIEIRSYIYNYTCKIYQCFKKYQCFKRYQCFRIDKCNNIYKYNKIKDILDILLNKIKSCFNKINNYFYKNSLITNNKYNQDYNNDNFI